MFLIEGTIVKNAVSLEKNSTTMKFWKSSTFFLCQTYCCHLAGPRNLALTAHTLLDVSFFVFFFSSSGALEREEQSAVARGVLGTGPPDPALESSGVDLALK